MNQVTQAQVYQWVSTMVACWLTLMFAVVLYYCSARLLNVLLSDEFWPGEGPGGKRARKWLVFAFNLFGASLGLVLFIINIGLVVFLGLFSR